ncbi:hypothetical protein FAES_2307 [Fibrella aestuarina BUZ 2]|uniref:Uncharacterized protein n=1 Tax=Fibrella aestuarina BUZ 2 TaxID=1166018 RepID=I0K863_9BACT|nr:hypothetical protein [Fibrella aestuarina]CCH00316.1 hypothetical protein FAES_2307 [Fibrella aestuarina BUZ 2]
MLEKYSNLIATLTGQVVSFGLAAFAWQYFQERLKKIDDVDRRVYRLEIREEQRKELESGKPVRPRSEPDPAQPKL